MPPIFSSPVVKSTIALAVMLVVWQLACVLFKVPSFLLPTPTEIMARLIEKHDLYVSHTLVTFYETIGGFILAVLAGALAATLIVVIPSVRDFVMPLLLVAQIVPKVAVAPIILIWFGYGVGSKLLIALLVAFFPIVVNMEQGLMSVERDLLELGHSLRASPWQIFWKFRLPTAIPGLFSGMKIAITLAVIGAVIGEFVGGNRGLGYLIIVANQELDTPLAFASVLILSVGGCLFYGLVALAERVIAPWAGADNATAELARMR